MTVKRNVIVFVLTALSFASYGQATVGFTFNPLLSTNRVNYDRDTDGRDFTSNDSGLRFTGGPIVDIQLTENYFVSSGILFASKRVGVTAQEPLGTEKEEVYNLQYVTLPATMKLFTNEVSLDTKVYFQFGASLDFLVAQKDKEETNIYINDFRLFDTSLIFGIGAEYKAGVNTALFGGFSYNRGLINSVHETEPMENKLSIKNDMLSLVLGIKF